MNTTWSSFYDDVNQQPAYAGAIKLARQWPCEGGYPQSRVLAQWLDIDARRGELDVQEQAVFESLSYCSRPEDRNTIDTIIFFVRNLIANGLDLPAPASIDDQSLKDDTLHFWHLLHHDFGQDETADAVIRGSIYETLSASCTNDPSHAFKSCEHLLKSSAILQTLLGKNSDLSSKQVFECIRSEDALKMRQVYLDENEAEDNVFGRKVQRMATSLARVDIPQMEGNVQIGEGKRITIQASPALVFITLQRPEHTEHDGEEPWWSFEQLTSFEERFTTTETDENGRFTGINRLMLYTLCLVLNMTNDQVRVYDPFVNPIAQVTTEGRNIDAGEWKVDVDAGPFLLVYRRADDDLDEGALMGKRKQFEPPIIPRHSGPAGRDPFSLTPISDLDIVSAGANATPPHEALGNMSPVSWGSEQGEIRE